MSQSWQQQKKILWNENINFVSINLQKNQNKMKKTFFTLFHTDKRKLKGWGTTTLGLMTLGITTLSMNGLFGSLSLNYSQHNNTAIMLTVIMPRMVHHFLICWMSLCWVSFCWMSLCWVSWGPGLNRWKVTLWNVTANMLTQFLH